MGTGHGVALSGAHEESILSGFKVSIQGELVHANADVFRTDPNFLILFDAGFSARNPTEGADLELTVVALLI